MIAAIVCLLEESRSQISVCVHPSGANQRISSTNSYWPSNRAALRIDCIRRAVCRAICSRHSQAHWSPYWLSLQPPQFVHYRKVQYHTNNSIHIREKQVVQANFIAKLFCWKYPKSRNALPTRGRAFQWKYVGGQIDQLWPRCVGISSWNMLKERSASENPGWNFQTPIFFINGLQFPFCAEERSDIHKFFAQLLTFLPKEHIIR